MANPSRFIVVEDWRRFQHYKDRTPLWIKNYTELMRDDDYLALTGHRRGILHGLWLEYAMSRCRLTDDTASLSRRLALRVTTADLESLNHAGFIGFSASAPLAETYADASPEVEVEEEKETPLPPFTKNRENRNQRKRAALHETFVRNVGHLMPDSELELELRERHDCDDLETRRLLELARTIRSAA